MGGREEHFRATDITPARRAYCAIKWAAREGLGRVFQELQYLRHRVVSVQTPPVAHTSVPLFAATFEALSPGG